MVEAEGAALNEDRIAATAASLQQQFHALQEQLAAHARGAAQRTHRPPPPAWMARAGALLSRVDDVALLLMLSPWWLLVFCANPASSAPDSEGSPRKAPNIQPRVTRHTQAAHILRA